MDRNISVETFCVLVSVALQKLRHKEEHFTFAFQIKVMSTKRFNPFGKFDFQILMILFLPFASLNTQFIFSKHVESVISL